MSDNLFHSQLESLFSDLEEVNEQPSPSGDELIAGWTFSCDAAGQYQECSPEVGDVLGVAPEDLIGQPLVEFGLTDESRRRLAEALRNGDPTKELLVDFLDEHGQQIQVILNLYQTPTSNGAFEGWHGFAQVLTDADQVEIQETAPAVPDEETAPPADAPLAEPVAADVPEESTPEFPDVQPAAVDEEQVTEAVAPAEAVEGPAELPDVRPATLDDEEDAPATEAVVTMEVTEPAPGLPAVADEDPLSPVDPPQAETVVPEVADPFAEVVDIPPVDLDDRTSAEAIFSAEEAEPADEVPDLQPEPPREEATRPADVPTDEAEAPVEGLQPTPKAERLEAGLPTPEVEGHPKALGPLPEAFIQEKTPETQEFAPETPPEQRPTESPLEEQAETPVELVEVDSPALEPEDEPGPSEPTIQESEHPSVMLDDIPGIRPGTARLGTGALQLGQSVVQPGDAGKPSRLSVPVRIQDQTKGLLEFIDDSPDRDWTDDERRLVEEIADQLSLALENAYLFSQTQQALEETETQAQRLARLNELSEVLSRAAQLEEVFGILGARTAEIIPADEVSLAMLDTADATHFRLIVLKGRPEEDPPRQVPLAGSSIEAAVRERRLVHRPDDLARDLGGVQSFMVAPLLASGRVMGTFNLGSYRPDAYSRRDENLMVQVASLLASTMESRNLFQQTEFALAETEALFRAGAELNSVQRYEDILNILRRYTIIGENSHHVSLTLFDVPWTASQAPEWQYAFAQWRKDTGPLAPRRMPLHKWTNLVSLLRSDAPTLLEDVPNDPRLEPEDIAAFTELAEARSALIVPLNVGGQWIGNLLASYTHHRSFPDLHIRRLMSLAGQAAVSIENLRLLEETRQRARQLQTAAEIARDASETLAVEELLNRSVKLIADRFGFYHVSIYLLDETGQFAVVRASSGKSGEELKRRTHSLRVGSKSVIGYVTQTGPLVLNDVSQYDLHQANPLLPDTRAELGIPLKVGDRIIGALDVQSAEVDPFSADDVAVLQTLADQVAVAVDNARSYELAQNAFQEARQRLHELSMLYEVSQSFSSAPLEMEEIANIIARQFVKVLRVPECSVSTLDAEHASLTTLVDIHVTDGHEYLDLEKVGRVYSLEDHPAIAEALETMQPKVVDLTASQDDLAQMARLHEEDYSRLVIIPMAAKGQPLGVIELKSGPEGGLSAEDELNLAMTLANQAAVTLENARLYEDQRLTADRLREVDILKSQFLANMSHELRTPLNSIIGFSRVILKGIDGPVTELQKQDLSAIYNAGQHLLGLINDILEFSKIEAGKMELSFEPLNLNELINSVMSTAVGLVKHKPIELRQDVPEDLPALYADNLRIRQVLLNLLSNAAKFTEEGSITVSARVQAGTAGRREVYVSVMDTGPGIAATDQDRLFLAFSQVDASPTRKSGGTGLGLSISRHLIEMHGGLIGVESEVGKGSTFYFTLPVSGSMGTRRLKSLFETPEPEEVAEVIEAPAEADSRPVVLSIDQDAKVIALYQRYLETDGYRVEGLTDPARALARARQLEPALITLDLMLPGHDGMKILQDLQTDPITSGIPVIICSIVEEEEEAKAQGARGYLVKPILEDDLKEAVQDVLDGSPTPGEPTSPETGGTAEILIVDQDPQDIRLLQILLHETGRYRVSVAVDGRQALETMLAERPQAILLNHELPDMDCFTFLKTARSNPLLRDIPILIFTEKDLDGEYRAQLARNSQALFEKNQLSKQDFLSTLSAYVFAPRSN